MVVPVVGKTLKGAVKCGGTGSGQLVKGSPLAMWDPVITCVHQLETRYALHYNYMIFNIQLG